jgi:transcriptional regulator with XRE-family HTH domain
VAERAGISQPALSRIELGGGVPDIETLRRLGNAMGVRFHVIVGNEEADHDENLLVSLAKPRLAGTSTEASHNDPQLGSCARGSSRRNSDHASLCWRRRLVGYQCPLPPSDRAH